MPLSRDEIVEIRTHAHRYAGPYTPTYFKLAAAVVRLADHLLETPAVCGDDLPTSAENAIARDHILRGALELAAKEPEPLAPSCGTCRYWFAMPEVSDNRGQCRRRPPIAFSGDELLAAFPQTFSADWCGEHNGRPHPLRVLG